MNDTPRLIERAAPFGQASLDSVFDKGVHHGQTSALLPDGSSADHSTMGYSHGV